jgi:Ran-binding protein 3
MAYASRNSPFTSVKGQNVFGSTKPASSTPSFGSPAPSTPATKSSSTFGQPSSASTPTLVKRTGFDAFSGSTSPFASVSRMKTPTIGSTSKLGRAKSPPRRTNSALSSTSFVSYAGASQSFALPAQKKARAGSPDGSSRSSLERTPSSGVFGESNNSSESGADDEQEDDRMSFGARLRAGKDEDEEIKTDEEKLNLTEQDGKPFPNI